MWILNSKKCIFFLQVSRLFDGFLIQHFLRKAVPSKYQYDKTNRNDRKCFNCSDYFEDEFHFILVCPKYDDDRLRFLKKFYWEKPSMFKLLQLFLTQKILQNCAI